MPRESQIPLFLWIATALLVHLLWGGGAEHAVEQIEQTLDIGRFARSVRQHVRFTRQTLEVTMQDDEKKLDESPSEPPEQPEVEPKQPEDQPKEDAPVPEPAPALQAPRMPKPVVPPEPPKQEEEKKKEKEKKKEEEKKEDEKKEKKNDADIEELKLKQRVAVRQHVDDKNQEDNPDAEFLGEYANRVKEQTQARITSTDQDAPDPNPGGHHAGPDSAPGNSSETRVAQSEDREGETDRPPSETSQEQDGPKPTPTLTMQPRLGVAMRAPAQQAPVAPQAGQKAAAAVEAQQASPETLTTPGGSFSISPARQAVAEQRARRARARVLGQRRVQNDPTALLGLGANGLTENGVNLNLTPNMAVAVVGQEQLKREKARDGERRRSEHRGSWKETSFEKYRASIENYVAGVKPGNQTALNTAHAPFANYLNAIHQRLHPIFAGQYLASLDRMPKDHPLNDMEMSTNIEIVLHPDDGHIVRMGVTKASGVTAFDIGALDSVRRASPFGAAPKSIVSPDGNVYLHWEFHRLPEYACSTYFARPYIIKAKPKSVPPKLPPPAKPYEGEEQPPGRQGRRDPIDTGEENGVRTAKR